MTLFFNLYILETETLCDPKYMLTALYKFYKGQTFPKSSTEKYKPLPNLKAGTSFLLNPSAFFKDKSTDISHKVQYLRLAGRRDYQLYKQYGIRYLDLTLFPDVDLALIRSNPLLHASQNKLHFKYER